MGRHLDEIVRRMGVGEINRTATGLTMAMEADRLDQNERITAALEPSKREFETVMRKVFDEFIFHLTSHNMDGDGI